MLNILKECAVEVIDIRLEILETVGKMKEEIRTLESLGEQQDGALERLKRREEEFPEVLQDILHMTEAGPGAPSKDASLAHEYDWGYESHLYAIEDPASGVLQDVRREP